jgi:hypothetical protein
MQLQAVLYMDVSLNTKFSKIKQIIYSLIVSPQPPVKSSGCALAAEIRLFSYQKCLLYVSLLQNSRRMITQWGEMQSAVYP